MISAQYAAKNVKKKILSTTGQLYQTAGAHSRRRLSGSSFGIGGLEGVEHGGCLNDPLYGLLNSLFIHSNVVWSTPMVLSEWLLMERARASRNRAAMGFFGAASEARDRRALCCMNPETPACSVARA